MDDGLQNTHTHTPVAEDAIVVGKLCLYSRFMSQVADQKLFHQRFTAMTTECEGTIQVVPD